MGYTYTKKFFTVSPKLKLKLGILIFHLLHLATLNVWQDPPVHTSKPLGWSTPKDQETKIPLLCLKEAGRNGPRRVESLLAPTDRVSPGSEGSCRSRLQGPLPGSAGPEGREWNFTLTQQRRKRK